MLLSAIIIRKTDFYVMGIIVNRILVVFLATVIPLIAFAQTLSVLRCKLHNNMKIVIELHAIMIPIVSLDFAIKTTLIISVLLLLVIGLRLLVLINNILLVMEYHVIQILIALL
jgi:hypothetical protein